MVKTTRVHFNGIELFLPQHLPGVNVSFPVRITPVQAFTAHAQPYLSSVFHTDDMSPGFVILILGFDYNETTKTHSDLSHQ